MKRADLEHLIRAAGDLLGEDTVIIVGSQAILASFPEASLPGDATRSLEADVLPLDDPDGSKADLIDGVLGELSRFDETFGIHGDGVSPGTAVLPDGWQDRLIVYANTNTNGISALCLERHDLCASKLVAFREKDRRFVRALIAAGLVDPVLLVDRPTRTAVPSGREEPISGFLRAVSGPMVQHDEIWSPRRPRGRLLTSRQISRCRRLPAAGSPSEVPGRCARAQDRTAMDLRDRPEDKEFRAEVRSWLDAHVVGDFAALGGRGGSGDETYGFDVRLEWEHVLAADRWTCLGWPTEHGGRGASIAQQVIFNEEYVKARAPGRVSIMGEGLIGPTIIHYGTDEQKARFLPPILAGTELWCQGYSEPNAGSDLANVQTKAVLDGDEWVVTGQKVWTSLAHQSDWCFVVCRTEPGSFRHKGLSYLLVPMDQPGVEVRPIEQLTGTSEFNEVFFDGARTARANVLGEVGQGWTVALATLAFERGVALLGHQVSFRRELEHLVAAARANGRAADPVVRQRLARAYAELEVLRYNTLRSLSNIDGPVAPPEASIIKLYWATWHRSLGELALDVLGPAGLVADAAPYELSEFQRTFLFSRSETIYGGSNEIQKNIIGERVLGLPPEPKPQPPAAPSTPKGTP